MTFAFCVFDCLLVWLFPYWLACLRASCFYLFVCLFVCVFVCFFVYTHLAQPWLLPFLFSILNLITNTLKSTKHTHKVVKHAGLTLHPQNYWIGNVLVSHRNTMTRKTGAAHKEVRLQEVLTSFKWTLKRPLPYNLPYTLSGSRVY